MHRDARACILGQGIQVTFSPSFYTPDVMQYSDNPNDEAQAIIENTASNMALNNPDKNVLSIVDVAGSDASGDGAGAGARKKRRKTNVAPRGVSFEVGMASTSASMEEAGPSLVESALAEIAAPEAA